MNRLLHALALTACLGALATPALSQQRAYAPENLRTLSQNDQVRVISLEYEEQSGGRRIPDDQLRFYLDQVNRSNWGFSQIKADIAQSLGGSPMPPQGGTVRCESVNNKAQTCRVPWSGPSRLVRKLSGAPCDEGRTWQSQRGQVYVGNGCRAEFGPAYDPGPTPLPTPLPGPVGGSVRCESVNNQAQICRVPWSGPSRLSRQLSGTACVEGRTWQSQRGQVYVGGGCRAEFVAASGNGGPGNGYSTTCSSNDNRRVTCPWPPSYGTPRLLEQLSRSPCIQGQTWGIQSATAIWVSQGCRGRFGN
ncbi:DUF3011 domain-containing protein [Lysobacter niastensis]|uniref:DUF3011 domain-containing protein n=1 Tax=Lysobacter niastensis TaxID=380629 RepID=A0ABS0BDB1_9GAMM|nr:DUF3011 domain-containing protein [Lysobacter niastensis]MBF6025684.1 DUF3011 domain-containing protein [Lysobacter niastensis]